MHITPYRISFSGFWVTVFLFLTGYVNAQEKTNVLRLTITLKDSLNLALLPHVIVLIKSEKTIKNTLLAERGELVINTLDTGKYTLSFTKIGYRQLDTTIRISDVENTLNVILKATTTNLKTVNVIARKQVFTQDLDKIIYNVKDDPLAVNNNLYFVMPKIPLVSLSPNEQVLLKGSQSFAVLVNGRKSALFANDPTSGFKSLPATNIERIEVYTIPPARFEAEGLTGVINIITKKPVAGYTGNINGDLATNNSDAGGQFNYKQGKVGISISAYGYDQYPPKVHQSMQRTTFGQTNTLLTEDGVSQNRVKLGYSALEFSLELDSLDLISISASGNLRKTKGTKAFADRIEGDMMQSFDYNNLNVSHDKNADLSFNYQRNFKNNKIKQFNYSYQYTTNSNDFSGNLNYSNKLNYDQPDLIQNNHSTFREYSMQVDYVQPIKKLLAEVGGKVIFRENTTLYNYAYQEPVAGLQRADDQNFDYHQKILGVYASLQYKWTNWGVKAGLRGEGTSISDTDNQNMLLPFSQHYFNIIPSVVIQRKLSRDESLSAGFTQRIQRPAIWQLNPFADRSNPNFYLSGNKNLRPVLNNVFELNYRNTGDITITMGGNYSFASNTIQRVVTYSSDSVSRSTYQNIGKNSNLGVNASLNALLFKRLDLSVNTRIYYTWLRGSLDQRIIENSGIQGNATLMASYRFNKTTSLNTSVGFTSDAILLQGSTNAYVYQIFNFNKRIPAINTTVSAGITNIFNKYRSLNSYVYSDDFNQRSLDRINSQIFRLSVNYQFGKQTNDKKARNIINNDDINRENSN